MNVLLLLIVASLGLPLLNQSIQKPQLAAQVKRENFNISYCRTEKCTHPIDSITLSCQCLSATTPALKLCRIFFVSFFSFFEFLRRGMLVWPSSSSFVIVFCETPLPIFSDGSLFELR